MKLNFFLPLSLICCLADSLFPINPASAQVTTDGTTSTTVDANGNNFEINNGDRAGGNLFHSFGDFSVPNGGEASFNNSTDISNILSRVTGGNISNINGLIRANGSANLFLINPAGIVFGEGARLDIGGSFLGSTADSILFEDGEFSAVNNLDQPILTINAPIGLNFRDNPEGIATISDPSGQSFANLTVNSGQSINLVGGDINLDGSFLNAPGGTIELGGLVASGEVGINNDGSLSFPEGLARSDISLNNGTTVNVAANNGGSIKINANNLEILGGSDILAGIVAGSQVADAQAGDITIDVTEKISLESQDPNNSSRIGNNVGDLDDLLTIGSSGNVTINSKILEGNGNFQIGSVTNGEGNAGNVNITAIERVSMLGIEGGSSGILSAVAPSATGNGADITITTPALVLSNSSLATSTIGQGNAGNIFINATDSISLSNVSQLQAASFFGIGDAGNIVIDAEPADISLEGENVLVGTIIASLGLVSDPVTIGQGGDIIITGRNLSATGGASLLTSTVGQATTEELANAGNIQIDVSENVTFTGGSQLQSQTLGQGNAGNVTITAGNEVSFDGENNQRSSGIINNVEQLPELLADNFSQQRQGGNISITASSFSLSSGADLNSSTSGIGNSGEIRIITEGTVTLTDAGTTIFSNVEAGGTGDSLGVFIDAQSLDVTDGAQIQTLVRGASETNPAGQGNAGDININVRDGVNFTGSGFSEADDRILSSQATSILASGATGSAGNINITGDSLSLSDGADINTSTSGTGNSGEIRINADSAVTITDAGTTIFSNVEAGGTGDSLGVFIDAQSLDVTDGAQIQTLVRGASETNPAGQGNAGDININVRDGVNFTGSGFSEADDRILPSLASSQLSTGATGSAGNIIVTGNSLSLTDGARLNTATSGNGDAGTISLNISDSINIDGTTPDGQFISGIFNTVESGGIGNGGEIEVTTTNLSISNGAAINAGIFGEGNGGSIFINATESISLDGTKPDGEFVTGIGSAVAEGAIGNGGEVEVTTTNLSISNGAAINAGTSGEGDGGSIFINATESISLDGTSPNGEFDSGIGSGVAEEAIGNGGNIEVTTNNLSITNGAGVFANTEGQGDGGNLSLNVNERLTLRENSTISTQAANNAQGGNITINAENGFVVAFPSQNEGNGNDITAFSNEGVGGNINITAEGVLGLDERDAVPGNETNDIDASGVVDGVVEINTPNSDAIQGASKLPNNPVDPGQTVAQACSSDRVASSNNFTVTGKGGIPADPAEPLDSEIININGETAKEETTNQEYVQVISTSQGDIIPAQGVEVTENGDIILTAYRSNITSRTPQINPNCNRS